MIAHIRIDDHASVFWVPMIFTLYPIVLFYSLILA